VREIGRVNRVAVLSRIIIILSRSLHHAITIRKDPAIQPPVCRWCL